MSVRVIHDDCIVALTQLAADGVLVDSVVTDPPYHLISIVKRFGGEGAAPAMVGATGAYARAARGFMGKEWDGGDVAFRPETWAAVLAVMKPGAHLIAFSGSRTYHRMACAIEDAGFEIRDQIMWLYGSGFPKNHKLGDGWGTALKPAHEPIVLARAPFKGSAVANFAAHGVGGLNIDGCRVEGEAWSRPGSNAVGGVYGDFANDAPRSNDLGRFPANVLHDGSDEVVGAFPFTASGAMPAGTVRRNGAGFTGKVRTLVDANTPGDAGSAARFFYSSKADAADRCGSLHPTVKPTDLMAYLCRLVTPVGGTVLDPFAGSGSTGMACLREGFDAILIEREAEYVADINRRLAHVAGLDSPLFGAVA